MNTFLSSPLYYLLAEIRGMEYRELFMCGKIYNFKNSKHNWLLYEASGSFPTVNKHVPFTNVLKDGAFK